jgi:hypothetical protein
MVTKGQCQCQCQWSRPFHVQKTNDIRDTSRASAPAVLSVFLRGPEFIRAVDASEPFKAALRESKNALQPVTLVPFLVRADRHPVVPTRRDHLGYQRR